MSKRITFLILLSAYVGLSFSQIPTTGLVGYWPFNGNANDLSGKGINGTVYGATLTTDRNGTANSAYSFNGTSSYILMTGLPINYTQYTFTGWIKGNTTSMPDNGMIVQTGLNPTASKAIGSFGFTSSGANYSARHRTYTVSGGGLNSIPATTSPDLNWHFYTSIWDGTTLSFYIDSKLQDTLNITSKCTVVNELVVGALRYGAGVISRFFNCAVDDIRVYNVALNQSEINILYNENAIVTTPTLTSSLVSSITITSAISGGNISNDGGASVTARGICWSTNANPTISNSKSSDGTGIGAFTSNLIGLTPNTTYYIRAYATNSAGTAYGGQLQFTTLQPLPLFVNLNFKQPQKLIANAGNDISNLVGSSNTIGGTPAANGGTPNYSYLWNPTNDLSNIDIPNPLASPLVTTIYNLLVTDANGCKSNSTIKISIDTITSLNKSNDYSIKINIYPNPNNGKFLVNLNGFKNSPINIEIINSLGQIFYTKQINYFQKVYNNELDLSNIQKGLYTIRVSNKTTSIDKIFIVD